MSQRRTILIADKDEGLRASLAEQLTMGDEFVTSAAASANAALAAVRSERPDLTLIDLALPDMDGSHAVRIMRASGYTNPIIMLAAEASDADIVTGLDAGANDCVSKPFRFAVLLARIRAHLRQYDGSEDALLHIGCFVFHPGSKHLITASGSKLRLTEKETAILRFLYRAGRQVVTRDVLLREVWGYNPNVTTHTLETHIYRLRQKIEVDPGHAQLLVTETGGYRLIA